MGLKILHSADWHLDSPFAGFDDSQRALLKQEQQSIPGKTAQLCRREKCDLLLLAGDIFDGEPARETVEVLKKALSECGARVFITPGFIFGSNGSRYIRISLCAKKEKIAEALERIRKIF